METFESQILNYKNEKYHPVSDCNCATLNIHKSSLPFPSAEGRSINYIQHLYMKWQQLVLNIVGEQWSTYLGGCGAGTGVGATVGTEGTTRLGLAISSPGTTNYSWLLNATLTSLSPSSLWLKVSLAKGATRLILTGCIPFQTLQHEKRNENENEKCKNLNTENFRMSTAKGSSAKNN